MRFIKAEAVTVEGRGFIRLARKQNMCQEKRFSQQMIYTLLKKNKKNNIWKHQAAMEDFDDYLWDELNVN